VLSNCALVAPHFTAIAMPCQRTSQNNIRN
jgi:hypothetical protein